MATKKKIGILAGQENTWLFSFTDEINRRDDNAIALMVKLGGTRIAEMCEYDVIVDRISHHIPYYRTFLKAAMLTGTRVINNPFWADSIDSFFIANMATRMNLAYPRSVALPSHSYHVSNDALGNLLFPIPWDKHIDYLGGFPVVLRPTQRNGAGTMQRLNSYDDLWFFYNQTGTNSMLLQEHLEWQKYIRCLVIGQQTFLLGYDPHGEGNGRYMREEPRLTAKEKKQVVDSAKQVSMALGCDMSALDFGFVNDRCYLVDVINPLPDVDANLPFSIFEQLVGAMADLTIDLAKKKRQPLDNFSWSKLADSTTTSSKKTTTSRTKSTSSTTAKQTASSSTASNPTPPSASSSSDSPSAAAPAKPASTTSKPAAKPASTTSKPAAKPASTTSKPAAKPASTAQNDRAKDEA
jgi:glutathione synthase/RimK-type ligase-like ATP-grasp enzyme